MNVFISVCALLIAACVALLVLHVRDLYTCADRGGRIVSEWVWMPVLVGSVTTIQLQQQSYCEGATR